jgi:hypothetical protein
VKLLGLENDPPQVELRIDQQRPLQALEENELQHRAL